jgi:hypothetical protein
MPSKYTRIVPVFGFLTAFTLIAGAASAQVSDQSRPQQPGAPGAQAPDQTRPQPAQPAPSPSRNSQAKSEDQSARGELSSIDATAKTLTIKPTAGAEQKFMYNDSTKVTGARGGVAGLATQSGKEVTIHFKNEGANRVATEIEVQADNDKGPGAGARPSPDEKR